MSDIEVYRVNNDTEKKPVNKLFAKIPFVKPFRLTKSFTRYKLTEPRETLVVEHRPDQSVRVINNGGDVVIPVSTHRMRNNRCFQVISALTLRKTFNIEVIENEA